jgi:hypothetical protein
LETAALATALLGDLCRFLTTKNIIKPRTSKLRRIRIRRRSGNPPWKIERKKVAIREEVSPV